MTQSTPAKTNMGFSAPGLLVSLDDYPGLLQKTKTDYDRLLVEILRNISGSQFARLAAVMGEFCKAIAGSGDPNDYCKVIARADSIDDSVFINGFRKYVPVTTYKNYAPFIKDDCSGVDSTAMPSPTSENEILSKPRVLKHPTYLSPLSPKGPVLYVPGHCSFRRIAKMNTNRSKDEVDGCLSGPELQRAMSLVEGRSSSFLLHALFVLADCHVTTMCFTLADEFFNVLRYIKKNWNSLVDCIETGIIPSELYTNELQVAFEAYSKVRSEVKVTKVPAIELQKELGAIKRTLHLAAEYRTSRAAELRAIGPPGDTQGWAIKVWPALTRFIGITGGSSASVVSKVTEVLGPSVTISNYDYSPTVCGIAVPYLNGNSATDLKIVMVHGLVEFVHVNSERYPVRVLSTWQLVTGELYTPILTSRDGLWRYCLGGVIKVKGFAPHDGMPVVNYVTYGKMAPAA